MKLSTGAKWGALTGLIFGLLGGVVGYLILETIMPQLLENMYKNMVESSASPEVARQAVQFVAFSLRVGVLVGSVLGNLLTFTIVGLIMAAVWDRLKLPWYGKGAIFSLALLVISELPDMLTRAPLGVPTPLAIFQIPRAVIAFAGPLVLAWLLEKRGG